MRAEIIAIGDELTSGQRLDTNSQWLSGQLVEVGVRVAFHTTVGDDLDANIDVFRLAMERADIVVITGGLGPTADDLTRDALAAACDVELVLDPQSLDKIETLFASRGRPMPERNRVQALFPRGATPIDNPHGSAPGIELRHERSDRAPAQVYALPGVPAEMKEMWTASVAPRILASLPRRRVLKQHVLKCFGVGESELENMLPDLIRRGRRPTVGITVSQATIALRIVAEGDDEGACDREIASTSQTIAECLGTLVFGAGDEELEHAVLRLLGSRGWTLAVDDGGTQGRLAAWLAAVEGPPVWRGAVVTREDAAGTTIDNMAGRHRECPPSAGSGGGANVSDNNMSLETSVLDRARRCRERFGATIGLAVGPWPRAPKSGPAGRIMVALSSDAGEVARSFSTVGHPDLLRTRAAKQALNLLRLWLVEQRTP